VSAAYENGRAATEVTTPPVAAVERASALPTAYFEDSRLRALREVDDFATVGHDCGTEPTADLCWYLSKAAYAVSKVTQREAWTMVTLCVGCQKAERRSGAFVYPCEWDRRAS
jgi:hypothetical protein